MAKITYEIDPHNRLILRRGKISRLGKYRTCIEGYFKTQGKNSLIYQAKITNKNSPQQLKFQGNWEIDKNHNLVFVLNKWGDQVAGNKLTLKGGIVNLGSNEIAFSIMTKEDAGEYSIYLLKLSGSWNVDSENKISFDVEREAKIDRLKFSASWSLNKNTLRYSYEKISVKSSIQNLTLCGFWDIREKYRLNYCLDKALGEELEFKVSLGELIWQGKSCGLKYELGEGFKSGRGEKRNFVIFGKWKVKNGIGLIFEVEYENGLETVINFNALIELKGNYSLGIDLKNREGDGLGISLQVTRKFLKSGEGFLRFLADSREKAIEVGTGFRW